jgi:hypothetical protein
MGLCFTVKLMKRKTHGGGGHHEHKTLRLFDSVSILSHLYIYVKMRKSVYMRFILTVIL